MIISNFIIYLFVYAMNLNVRIKRIKRVRKILEIFIYSLLFTSNEKWKKVRKNCEK